jgi:hypothetical protein
LRKSDKNNEKYEDRREQKRGEEKKAKTVFFNS